MTRRRHIHAIGDDATASENAEALELGSANEETIVSDHAPAWEYEIEEPITERRTGPWMIGAAAGLTVIGWTVFFAWSHREAMLAGGAPGQWADWITQWATPVVLVGIAWLLAMRSSTREAARFEDVAQSLSRESALLEGRLVVVNRELSLAREFLAAQSRDLDYLGRSAAERISEHAASLQALVINNGAQVDAIAGVSATAMENMAQLRDNLPVIANSARDVTNQIGGAGRTAKAQLDGLIVGFERLNEFGQASERQVHSLRERIDTSLRELGEMIDSIDKGNADRFALLASEAERLRAEHEAREAAIFETTRQRSEDLRAELMAASDARQLEEAAALGAMRGRVSSFTREAHEAAAAIRVGERAALEAWETQVAALRDRLEQMLEEIGALDETFLEKAREKLATLTAEAQAVDDKLIERDRAFEARVRMRQEAFDEAEADALARIAEQAAHYDELMQSRHAVHIDHADAIGERSEALATRIAEIEAHMASVVERSAEAERSLTLGADSFANTVNANSGQLEATEAAVARLTDASVRLLELIQAAAAHSRNELPAAIEGFESQLDSARASSSEIRETLDQARSLGDTLSAAVADVQATSRSAIGSLDVFRAGLAGTAEEQAAALASLREQLAATGEDSRALADAVAGKLAAAVTALDGSSRESLAELERGHTAAIENLRERVVALGSEQRQSSQDVATALTEAIAQLKDASGAMIADLEAGQSARIAAIAGRIGDASANAIDRAIEARTQETVAAFDEATTRSAETSRAAVANLRDQLARVHELTVNLESRALRAREQVEEQVDNDFARRMALITESLNSHSIDIAKALSTEVTDMAWASYLKGDRGVFTRRAVRLIDNGEAREISHLYENDHEFRDHVSRYIHDFEAMLRTMLSTRDGHALGVTLLSSDMGKLYVAMAQAIQRLRQ